MEPAWLVQLQRVERQVKVSVAPSRLALLVAGFHLWCWAWTGQGRRAGVWEGLSGMRRDSSHSLAASEA